MPGLKLAAIAQTLQGGDRCHRHGCGLLEGQIGRFQSQYILRSTDILGKTAATTLGNIPKYLITRLELGYVFTNRFDPTGYVNADFWVFGFEQPLAHQANQEDVSGQEMPVIGIYGGCQDLYQDFIILGSRFFYIDDFKNIRWSVFGVNNCFHDYFS